MIEWLAARGCEIKSAQKSHVAHALRRKELPRRRAPRARDMAGERSRGRSEARRYAGMDGRRTTAYGAP